MGFDKIGNIHYMKKAANALNIKELVSFLFYTSDPRTFKMRQGVVPVADFP